MYKSGVEGGQNYIGCFRDDSCVYHALKIELYLIPAALLIYLLSNQAHLAIQLDLFIYSEW